MIAIIVCARAQRFFRIVLLFISLFRHHLHGVTRSAPAAARAFPPPPQTTVAARHGETQSLSLLRFLSCSFPSVVRSRFVRFDGQ